MKSNSRLHRAIRWMLKSHKRSATPGSKTDNRQGIFPLKLFRRENYSSGLRQTRGPLHECCEPGAILLCMGLFSRFCVQALRYTAEEALRHVRDYEIVNTSRLWRIDFRSPFRLGAWPSASAFFLRRPPANEKFLHSLQHQFAALIEHARAQGHDAGGPAGRQFSHFERGINRVVGKHGF
jgi:hypothetical protein